MMAQILAVIFSASAAVFPKSRIDGNRGRSAGSLRRADGCTDRDGAHDDRGPGPWSKVTQGPCQSRKSAIFFVRWTEARRKCAKSKQILPPSGGRPTEPAARTC